MKTQKTLADVCDQYGELMAEQAALKIRIDILKKKLLTEGEGAYEGDIFRVTVATSFSNLLDMDAVREKLTPQFIAAHTREVFKTSIKCVARNGCEKTMPILTPMKRNR